MVLLPASLHNTSSCNFSSSSYRTPMQLHNDPFSILPQVGLGLFPPSFILGVWEKAVKFSLFFFLLQKLAFLYEKECIGIFIYEKEVSLQVLDSKKGSHQEATQPVALTSLAAAVSFGEYAASAVTKKCTKANLHLVLAQCVPHPMPSFHNPNDRRVELSSNWLNFSNSFYFHN